jgi:glycosyltransferase involved in cell wall biosynthesis
MKILLVIPHFPPPLIGGGDAVYVDLVNVYKKLGHEVHVLFGDQTEKNYLANYTEFQKEGVFFYRFPMYPTPSFAGILSTVLPINFWASIGIKKVLQQINPGFVHIHGYGLFMPAQVAKACIKLKIKYTFTIHGAPVSPAQMKNPIISLAYSFYRKFYGFPLLQNANRLTAVSTFAADFPEFVEYRHKIEIIYNGIDTTPPAQEDFDICKYLDIQKKENTKIILSLGRIEWWKGFQKIIELIPEMTKKGYEPIYCIAGKDNGYKKTIIELAKKLEIEKNIKFIGFIEGGTKNNLLNNINILAIPSINGETFGLTALEGRLYKKPIVTTFFGGLKDALDGYSYSYNLENWEKAFGIDSDLVKGSEDDLSMYKWENIANQYLSLTTKIYTK